LNKNNALIIFTRNPELGKCKTRLAKTIGDKAALEVYKYLLQHTADVAKKIDADRYVFYSENIIEHDIWDTAYFRKKLQRGSDLGERMHHAFEELFSLGYQSVCIVGSDLLDLNSELIENAYQQLENNEVVIGPAKDGGYYLLAMKQLNSKIFRKKDWGTETVRESTIADLQNHSIFLLKELNDIDTFEDMKDYEELRRYYNKSIEH